MHSWSPRGTTGWRRRRSSLPKSDSSFVSSFFCHSSQLTALYYPFMRTHSLVESFMWNYGQAGESPRADCRSRASRGRGEQLFSPMRCRRRKQKVRFAWKLPVTLLRWQRNFWRLQRFWKEWWVCVGNRYQLGKYFTNVFSMFISYLIFVTKFTCETCGEKSVMWRNFRFIYMANGEKSDKCSGISDFSTWQMWRIVKSWQLWRNLLFLHMTDVKNWNLPCFVAKSVD